MADAAEEMSSTFSYPRVHVVGSGAYYSYRPVTRYIEKADRNFIREASSRPYEFQQYGAVAGSRGDGFSRRGLSAYDPSSGRKNPSDKDDSFFKHGHHDDSFLKKVDDDFSLGHGDLHRKHGHDDLFSKRGHESSKYAAEDSHHLKHRRDEASSSYLKKKFTTDETATEKFDRDALFTRDDDALTRLRRKHPFRLAVENEYVPPHESSIWPESRPHFDLVSSYDTMVDFIGIRDKTKN